MGYELFKSHCSDKRLKELDITLKEMELGRWRREEKMIECVERIVKW